MCHWPSGGGDTRWVLVLVLSGPVQPGMAKVPFNRYLVRSSRCANILGSDISSPSSLLVLLQELCFSPRASIYSCRIDGCVHGRGLALPPYLINRLNLRQPAPTIHRPANALGSCRSCLSPGVLRLYVCSLWCHNTMVQCLR